MKVSLYNKKGKKSAKDIVLDDSVFGVEPNEQVVLQAIRVYRSNQRVGSHTKVRSEVRGGGKKPWANNKVGRARSSSIRNPIWKGGGVVFGPRNDRNYKLRMPSKMRAVAFRSLFSMKSSSTIVVEDLSESELSRPAKEMEEFIKKAINGSNKRVLFILKTNEPKLVKALNGLDGAEAVNVSAINVFALSGADSIVIEESALSSIVEFWGSREGQKKSEENDNKKSANRKKRKSEDDLVKLGIEDSLRNKLSEGGVVSRMQLEDVVNGKIKVKGVGPKSIELLKKALK